MEALPSFCFKIFLLTSAQIASQTDKTDSEALQIVAAICLSAEAGTGRRTTHPGARI